MAKAGTKLFDLAQPWSGETWPWLGSDGPIITQVKRLPADKVMVRKITTTMHAGTHMDSPLHCVDGLDTASIPLDLCYHEGVIVDISDKVKEWDIIYPEHITSKMEVKQGDILVVHTGWHHYYLGMPQQNETQYLCYYPGPGTDFVEWAIKKGLRWVGMDIPGADHPMNQARHRDLRPDLVKKFEQKVGKSVKEVFGDQIMPMHTIALRHNVLHVENIGGDIDKVLNRRAKLAAFPIRWIGGDGSLVRPVAIIEE